MNSTMPRTLAFRQWGSPDAYTKFERSAVVRAAEAEVAGAPNVKVRLLADSSATGGALSTVRVSLEKGADGARPHWHEKSAEMFTYWMADCRCSQAPRS
jgi:hypothetical protein